LKQVNDLIAPVRRRAVQSFTDDYGHFPRLFKDAFITPIVNKAGLYPTDASSYRSISNLPVLSKVLERLVVRQIMECFTSAELLPPLQSGFRPGHSTEIAILHVMSDIRQWRFCCNSALGPV